MSSQRSRFRSLLKKQPEICLTTLLLSSTPALANPTGGQVVSGQASISQTNPNITVIQQTSQNAIINWQDFSIGAGQTTQFQQPNAQSVTLNRVVGGNTSQIMGNLKANGQVFLVNPNGIVFGKTAVVDVGGLVASTADISNEDFMSGRYHFQNAPDHSFIIQEGMITVHEGGLAALVAPQVANHGIITAQLGRVALASGKSFDVVDLYGDGLINLDVTTMTDKGRVDHTGQINADGGTVLLSVADTHQLLDNVVNVSGYISATHVDQKNGKIILQGGQNSHIAVSGTLDVSGTTGSGKGGQIALSGDYIELQSGAVLNANGNTGGGTIHVGGNYFHDGIAPVRNDFYTADYVYVDKNARLSADALLNGNGGEMILWADKYAWVYGSLSSQGGAYSGNGGRIETSGFQYLDVEGIRINTLAANGMKGLWLLDPEDVTITDNTTSNGSFNGGNPNTFTPTAAGSQVSATTINTNLNSADVLITSTNNGDVTFANTGVSILVGSGRDFSVNSSRNILFSGSNAGGFINASSGSTVNLTAQIDIDDTGATAGSSLITGQGSVGVISQNGDILLSNGTIDAADINMSVTTGILTVQRQITLNGSGQSTFQASSGNMTFTNNVTGGALITQNGSGDLLFFSPGNGNITFNGASGGAISSLNGGSLNVITGGTIQVNQTIALNSANAVIFESFNNNVNFDNNVTAGSLVTQNGNGDIFVVASTGGDVNFKGTTGGALNATGNGKITVRSDNNIVVDNTGAGNVLQSNSGEISLYAAYQNTASNAGTLILNNGTIASASGNIFGYTSPAVFTGYAADNATFLAHTSTGGTRDLYYLINNQTDLNSINTNAGSLAGHYAQNGDLDLTGFTTSIGSLANPFTGAFNGNGFQLTNLSLNTASDNVGLFGVTNGATFQDITLTNSTINVTGTHQSVGALVGSATNTTLMGDIVVSGGSVTASNSSSVGGAFGSVNGSLSGGTLSVDTDVTGSSDVGGVIGTATNSTITSTLSASNTVTGTSSVGGVVGSMSNSSLTQASTSGTVNGTTDVGGIVGVMTAGSTLSQSYNNSNNTVYGTNNVGGIVGSLLSGTVSDVLFGGTIQIVGSGNNVGGLIGNNNGTINTSLSVGTILGSGNNIGAIAGTNTGTLNNPFYATDTYPGLTAVGSGSAGTSQGASSAALSDPATFIPYGWSFPGTWTAGPAGYYVTLSWCGAACAAPNHSSPSPVVPGTPPNLINQIVTLQHILDTPLTTNPPGQTTIYTGGGLLYTIPLDNGWNSIQVIDIPGTNQDPTLTAHEAVDFLGTQYVCTSP